MLIYNATLLPLHDDQKARFLGWVEIEGDRIRALGQGAPARVSESDFDARGGFLTPGLIDAHSHLGMIGDALGFESDDINEDSDPVTPQLRAIDAIHPFDRGFADARQGGVTCVLTGPGSANTIGGTMAAIKTAGNCVDQMAVVPELAMKFALGENPKCTYHQKSGGPETRMGAAALIREALEKAKRYGDDKKKAANDPDNASPPDYDQKSEALLPVLERRVQAHFHAHRADDICTAIRIAKEFDLDYRIVHCTQGHLIADVLQTNRAKALLGPFFMTRTKPELDGADDAAICKLTERGVECCIVTDHPEVPQQNLILSACLAVKNGLDPALALAAVTANPAKLLGLFDRLGSIAPGKDADLVLWDRDPLDFYAKAQKLWINGETQI